MAQLNVITLFLLADTHCIVFTKFIFRSEILRNQNLGVRHMCPGSQSFKKNKTKPKPQSCHMCKQGCAAFQSLQRC